MKDARHDRTVCISAQIQLSTNSSDRLCLCQFREELIVVGMKPLCLWAAGRRNIQFNQPLSYLQGKCSAMKASSEIKFATVRRLCVFGNLIKLYKRAV